MKYAKQISNGYIVACGEFQDGIKITNAEYDKILSAFKSRPDSPEGYTCKLRDNSLEWELIELPPIEPEPLTEEQALTRYANELTGQNDPDLISAAETLITDRIKED